MERWIEKPSEDFLMFLPVWIRLRNIPVNYYTEDTIKEIAACVGQVLKVELDLEKSRAQDYVRIQVLLDVRNPLRNFKDVQIPTGEIISVTFDFERIRKRCFICQRLTHEKGACPYAQSRKISGSEDPLRQSNLSMLEGKEVLINNSSKAIQSSVVYSSPGDSYVLLNEIPQNLSQEFCSPTLPKDDGFFDSANLKPGLDDAFQQVLNDAGSSGLSIKQKNPKKRKASLVRKKTDIPGATKDKEVSLNIEFANAIKSKKDSDGSETSNCFKKEDITVVPSEPSQYQ